MLALAGCGEPSIRELKNRRELEALLTAISLKNAKELDKDSKRIDDRHSSGELSDASYKLLEEIVKQQRAAGKTVLVVSHALGEVARVCDRLAVLVGGRLAYLGTLGSLLHDPNTGEERSPSVLIEFSKWKLNSKIADSVFAFKAPAGAKKQKATTGARGEFAFRVPVAAMRYALHAQARGYASQDKRASIEGEQRVEVTFLLAPESKQ